MEVRCPGLVGRDDELARLTALVQGAAGGDGQALILSGPAGVGKTALARRVASLNQESGGSSLTGRAVPDAAVPFRMLTEVAVSALSSGADLEAPDLVFYKHTLLNAVGRHGSGARAADETSTHPLVLAEALLNLTSSLSQPVVVVLEDLHWADPDTLDAVEYLCDHLPGRSIALVVTIRSDEPSPAGPVVGRLASRRAAQVVDVEPLDRAALVEMIDLCGRHELDQELVDTIIARSEGRPLLVEELLGMIAVNGPGGLDDGQLLPTSLVDSVRARLARMPTAPRRLVVLAAEIGIDVELSVLEELTTLGPVDLDTALSAIEAAAFGHVDGSAFRFGHGLTRDAVLEAATAAERRAVAGRALGLLGDTAALDDQRFEAAAALAPHSGRLAVAAALHLEAGRRALGRGALRSAVAALTAAHRSPGADYLLRADAAADLVEALAHGGHVVEAKREGVDALRMARSRADADARARIQLSLVRADLGAEQWAETLAGLDDLDDVVALRPEALSLRALALLGAGRFDDAVEAATAVIERATTEDHAAARCESFEVLGRVERANDLDRAADLFEQGVRTAESAGLRSWRARALHELATIRQLDTGLVDQHQVALDAALEAGAFGVATGVLFHLGAVHGVNFSAERALEEGRRGLELARRLGTARQAAMAWITIGQAHAVAGREAQARAAATEAMALAPDDLEIGGLARGACTGLALILNERRAEAVDETAAAVELLEQLPHKTPVSTWYLWPLLASVERLDGPRALAVTDTAELRIARGFDALWLLAAAVDAGRRGDRGDAGSLLDRSLEQFDRCPGFVGYRHLGLRIAAEAAVEDGWADPEPWLLDAAQWFEEFGLTRPARAALDLAGVRRRRRRGTPEPPALAAWGITGREVDVLSLLGEGLTNREIGSRLYISPRTVRTHIEHLLTKTSTSNRAQLAALAAPHLVGDEP